MLIAFLYINRSKTTLDKKKKKLCPLQSCTALIYNEHVRTTLAMLQHSTIQNGIATSNGKICIIKVQNATSNGEACRHIWLP